MDKNLEEDLREKSVIRKISIIIPLLFILSPINNCIENYHHSRFLLELTPRNIVLLILSLSSYLSLFFSNGVIKFVQYTVLIVSIILNYVTFPTYTELVSTYIVFYFVLNYYGFFRKNFLKRFSFILFVLYGNFTFHFLIYPENRADIAQDVLYFSIALILLWIFGTKILQNKLTQFRKIISIEESSISSKEKEAQYLLEEKRLLQQLTNYKSTELIIAVKKEKNLLAEELKSNISDNLKSYLEILKDCQLSKELEMASKLIVESCKNIDEAIFNINSMELTNKSLKKSILLLFQESALLTGIKYRINWKIDKNIISDFNTHIIFRIIKELLHNIIKHAQASKVVLGIYYRNSIKIELSDNGIGFNRSSINEGTKFGLPAIEDRIISIGGNIKFENNRGTKISINIPL